MFQVISVAVIAALVAIDRITKVAILSTVKAGDPVEFLFGAFQLRYVENTGAAFSMLRDRPEVLTVFICVVVVICLAVVLSHKIKKLIPNICLTVMIAGGIGNVIDRFMYGYVVDFIEPLFINFAVFNFADCCITVGAFALMIYEIVDVVKESKKAKKVKRDV